MGRSGCDWAAGQRMLKIRDRDSRMQLVLMARAEASIPQASAGGVVGSAVGDDLSGMPDFMLPQAATN